MCMVKILYVEDGYVLLLYDILCFNVLGCLKVWDWILKFWRGFKKFVLFCVCLVLWYIFFLNLFYVWIII